MLLLKKMFHNSIIHFYVWISLWKKIVICLLLFGILGNCSSNPTKYITNKLNGKETKEQKLLQDLQQADQHYQQQQYEQAEQNYLEIVKKHPQNIEALYRMGNVNFKLGRYHQAGEYFEQVVNISPKYAKAHYNLAVTHLILSEQYFKFYTATVDPKVDTQQVVRILKLLHQFSQNQPNSKASKPEADSLDALANELE